MRSVLTLLAFASLVGCGAAPEPEPTGQVTQAAGGCMTLTGYTPHASITGADAPSLCPANLPEQAYGFQRDVDAGVQADPPGTYTVTCCPNGLP